MADFFFPKLIPHRLCPRPKCASHKLQIYCQALARRMKENGETAGTICQTLGIGRTTLYRYLAESAED